VHLARRGELVALEVQDIDFHPDGILISTIRPRRCRRGAAGAAALRWQWISAMWKCVAM
jgi:hypothetical protein